MNTKDKDFVEIAKVEFGERDFSRQEVKDLCDRHGIPVPRWLLNDERHRVNRGIYNIKELITGEQVKNVGEVQQDGSQFEDFIPSVDPLYIKFGHHKAVSEVVKSNIFYPVYLSGLSGNGKTTMIEQACAENRRECYRVNITIETDEDDLLGGFRLVQDKTKWFDGPAIKAMQSGGILLLDEVNMASSKIMCLQPILEGKGIFLKKINQYVRPAKGFNVIATANTKGQGDETGKFAWTNTLNEAFLDRFAATFEQDYPNPEQERRILNKIFQAHNLDNMEDYVETLIKWAAQNRQTFNVGGISDVISTRRLVHIVNGFCICGDKIEALERSLSRFDTATKSSMIGLFKSFDVDSMKKVNKGKEKVSKPTEFALEDMLGTKL